MLTIKVHFDFPPIPVRHFDYCAVTDDYEPGSPMGHGATANEAVDDLLDQLADDGIQLDSWEVIEE